MISLDQILLLEQRVESAVAKIAQLQAENDALRSKCSELTNALSSKSEQLSTFESDQNKIESGILKALDRLTSSTKQPDRRLPLLHPIRFRTNRRNHFKSSRNPQKICKFRNQPQNSLLRFKIRKVSNSSKTPRSSIQCSLFINRIFPHSQLHLKTKTVNSIFFNINLWQKERFK